MRFIPLVCSIAVAVCVTGCDDGTAARLEDEIMMMQERLLELETQVADAQAHANRLGSAVTELEANVNDVERAVIDLSAWVSRDLLVDTEATLGLAKMRLTEVRQRTDALRSSLRPSYDEEG